MGKDSPTLREHRFVAKLALATIVVSAPNVHPIIGSAQRRVSDATPVGDSNLLPVARVRFTVRLLFQVCGEQVVRCDIDEEVAHADLPTLPAMIFGSIVLGISVVVRRMWIVLSTRESLKGVLRRCSPRSHACAMLSHCLSAPGCSCWVVAGLVVFFFLK